MGKQQIYNGVTYTVDDNLSKEQGEDVIKDFLARRDKKDTASSSQKDGDWRKTESEGLGWEIGEGIVSGAIGIVQGAGETVGSLVDLVADTDIASGATNIGEGVREKLNLDPVGYAGKGAEIITQFAIPGGLAVGAVTKGSRIAKAFGLPKFLKEGTKTARKVATGKASKGQKVGLAVQQVAAAGVADAVVATDGITILGDFYQGGSDEYEKFYQSDQTTGLTGRDEAVRRLLNKAKMGVEGGVAQAILPPLIGAVATGAGTVALKTGLPQGLAKAGNKGLKKVEEGLANIERKQIKGEYAPFSESLQSIDNVKQIIPKAVGEISSVLRYRGYLPQEVAEIKSLIAGTTQAEIKGAQVTLGLLEESVDKAIKTQQKIGGTELSKKTIYNTIEEVLTTPSKEARDRLYQNLPDGIVPNVKRMRGQIDQLSESVLKSDFVKNLNAVNPKTGEELTKTIKKNLGSYIRKRYNIFEKKNYQPTKEVLEEAKQGFKGDKKATIKELNEVKNSDPNKTFKELGLSEDGKALLNPKITDEQAELATQSFLLRYRPKNNGSGVAAGGKTPIDYLSTSMFIEKTNLAKYQKELLGEVSNPRESFLSTVADLSEFRAVDDYFARIRKIADGPNNDSYLKKLFVNTKNLSEENIKALTKGRLKGFEGPEYKVLGEGDELGTSKWGSLQGIAVPDTIYKQLTRTVNSDENAFKSGVKALYGTFLKGKGITQYGKTVLSPITQIRNVTTAAAFAAMQGNIGKGASLGEAVGLVFNDIRRGWAGLPGDAPLKQLKELQELGVISTQAELKEIQALISKGMVEETGPKIVNGVKVGRNFGNSWTDNKMLKFFSTPIVGTGRVAQDLYQGGDNIWKIYNYTFEMNKLKNALRDISPEDQVAYLSRESSTPITKSATPEVIERLMKEEAARIVRNTVPNYNLVPTAIKELRKLPIGNFIAFPAEIIRTTTNTLARGIDELASDVPKIQEIGLRRLTGALTTSVIAPSLASSMAYSLSGVPKEVMDAYKRSGAPYWEKNARLLPTGRDKDGKITYVNYSYSNPYDMVTRGVIGAMNQVKQGKELGISGSKIAANAILTAMSETFNPFTSESIMAAKIRDIYPAGDLIGGRGGRVLSGAEVYNEEEEPGEIARKSFNHIVGGILPSVMPLQVRGGEWEASRFSRSVINSLNLSDELGVSKKDSMNREREITEELGRAFTGITEQKIDLPVSVGYKGQEFQAANRKASGIFNRIAKKPNVTTKQLKRAFQKVMIAKYRIANEFRQTVEDYKTMGLDEGEIYTALKNKEVSGADNIVFGDTYIPFQISKPILQEMARNDTIGLLPWDDINKISEEYINRGYDASLSENEVTDDGGGDNKNIFQKIIETFIPPAGASELPVEVDTSPKPVPPPVSAPINVPPPVSAPPPPPQQAPLNIQPPSAASSAGNINPLLVTNPVTRATFGSQ